MMVRGGFLCLWPLRGCCVHLRSSCELIYLETLMKPRFQLLAWLVINWCRLIDIASQPWPSCSSWGNSFWAPTAEVTAQEERTHTWSLTQETISANFSSLSVCRSTLISGSQSGKTTDRALTRDLTVTLWWRVHCLWPSVRSHLSTETFFTAAL